MLPFAVTASVVSVGEAPAHPGWEAQHRAIAKINASRNVAWMMALIDMLNLITETFRQSAQGTENCHSATFTGRETACPKLGETMLCASLESEGRFTFL